MQATEPAPSARSWSVFRTVERVLRKYLIVVVILSLVWMAVNYAQLGVVLDRLPRLYVIGVVTLVGEIAFVGGLVAITVSLGQHIFAGTGFSPRRWLKAIGDLRGRSQELLTHTRHSRLYRYGFNANLVGAVLGATGLPLLALILWVLPPSSWGLVIIPVVDLMATLSLRLALRHTTVPSQTEPEASP